MVRMCFERQRFRVTEWGIVLAVLVLAALGTVPAAAQDAPVPNGVVYVDTRLLLLAHPLFHQLDEKTRRFTNTSSEPVLGEEGVRRLIQKLDQLQKTYDQLPAVWQKRISEAPVAERKALEQTYLAEKAALQERLSSVRRRRWAVVAIPGREGVSEPASIISQLNVICGDIRDTLRDLRQSTQAGLILDISSLMPAGSAPINDARLHGNYLAGFVRGSHQIEDVMPWLKEARKFWLNHSRISTPVIVGAYDARLDAVQLLIKRVGR